MRAPIRQFTRRAPPWTPLSDASCVGYWLIDAQASGCTVGHALMSTDLTTWSTSAVTVTAVDDYYRIASGVDAGVEQHSAVCTTITDAIAGVFTFEVELLAWTGVVNSCRISVSGSWLEVDLTTGAIAASGVTTGTIFYTRIKSNYAGGYVVRFTATPGTGTTIGAIGIRLQQDFDNYQGAAPATLDVRCVHSLGILQSYASEIPNLADAANPMLAAGANQLKLYDPMADAWYGEAAGSIAYGDYHGGWFGRTTGYAACAGLAAQFSGSGDVPITAACDVRPVGFPSLVAAQYALWGLDGTAKHGARLVNPANNYAEAWRIDDSSAQSNAARNVATASGQRRFAIDRFTGTERYLYYDGAWSTAAAQNLGTCTFTSLRWGNWLGAYQQGHSNMLAVFARDMLPNSFHGRQLLRWMDSRYGVRIVTPPATQPEFGTAFSTTVSVPEGWHWTLTLGGYAVAEGRGTGSSVVASGSPAISAFFSDQAILRLATSAAGAEIGHDCRLINITKV